MVTGSCRCAGHQLLDYFQEVVVARETRKNRGGRGGGGLPVCAGLGRCLMQSSGRYRGPPLLAGPQGLREAPGGANAPPTSSPLPRKRYYRTNVPILTRRNEPPAATSSAWSLDESGRALTSPDRGHPEQGPEEVAKFQAQSLYKP